MKVHEIILQQLGGNKFKIMTGSKNVYYDHNELQMDLVRNLTGAKRLNIHLDASDTYTLKFWKFTKKGMFLVKEIKGVYCDMLQSIFTEQTGLYTSLGTMGK